jgi:hypothetical protein
LKEVNKMKRKSGSLSLVALLSLFILSACGGGGNPSPIPPAQPSAAAGIWIGTFTSNVTHTTSNATGLIADTNSARFGFPDTLGQFSGVLSVNGNSFSMTATAYAPHGSTLPDGSKVSTVTIVGAFTQKSAMSGTYSGAGDSGTFTLTYSTFYERPSSFPGVSGIWKGKILDFTNFIKIDENGAITGVNTTGCTYGGHLDLIDPSFNIYFVHLDIDTCGSDNGNYDGLGYLSDTSATNDTFITIISSPTLSLIASLSKQ